MRSLREQVDVRLAADELIRLDRRIDDLHEVADVAILKVPTLGGVATTLDVARRVGVPVVISSALDSSLGLAAGLAAACALPEPPLACGLGTSVLFAEDTAEPLLPVAGVLAGSGYPRPVAEMPVVTQDLDYWAARVAAAMELLPD